MFNFPGYEVTWDDETDTVSNIHTLQSDANTDNLQITSLSWNCTGSTIAAAYLLKIHGFYIFFFFFFFFCILVIIVALLCGSKKHRRRLI